MKIEFKKYHDAFVYSIGDDNDESMKLLLIFLPLLYSQSLLILLKVILMLGVF
jgi:hypothetical protein